MAASAAESSIELQFVLFDSDCSFAFVSLKDINARNFRTHLTILNADIKCVLEQLIEEFCMQC
jgi:hypothetical protein